MKDIIDRNKVFFVYVHDDGFIDTGFMKDICLILNDHFWLTEHIKIIICICQFEFIIRKCSYNYKESLNLLYCIWFRTAFKSYVEVPFFIYVEVKAVLCTLCT
jgi:hypothetical protein